MNRIVKISAHKILASLGDETVEATMELSDGFVTSASVPAGLSAGKHEIKKVSADKAIVEIAQINTLCQNKNWEQKSLDNEISKYNFGGNSTLAVSAAFFKAEAKRYRLTANRFPKLMLLLFEGGKHGSANNPNLSIQEFLLIEESVSQAHDDFEKLHEYLIKNGAETLVGAEGGFSPAGFDNIKALDTIKTLFSEKKIALDIAASFGIIPNYSLLLSHYNLVSIEDPFGDDDWNKWSTFFQKYQNKLQIVGDDLTTTNPDRITLAVQQKTINAVVIKPNQIGTISGAIAAVETARQAGLKIIVSHRGEETNDTWIVDFALFVQADFVKFGGMDRGERIAKYNRLLEFQTSLSPR